MKKAYAVDMNCLVFGMPAKYVLYLRVDGKVTNADVIRYVQNLRSKGHIEKTDSYAGKFIEIPIVEANRIWSPNEFYHKMNPVTHDYDWANAEKYNRQIATTQGYEKRGYPPVIAKNKGEQAALREHDMGVIDKIAPDAAKIIKDINKPADEIEQNVIDPLVQSVPDVISGINSIVSILGSIAKMLPVLVKNMELLLAAQAEAWKGMEPIYKHFNDEVVEPYKQLMTTDAGKVLEKLKKDIIAGNLDSNTLTPDIHGPWSEPAMYAQLGLLFANPYAGPGNLAALNVMRQVRYEQGTGRGPATIWDVMARASTMGQPDAFKLAAANVPQMVSDAGQMAAKIPEWWMSNLQMPPIASERKNITPRPDAGQKKHSGKAWRPKL